MNKNIEPSAPPTITEVVAIPISNNINNQTNTNGQQPQQSNAISKFEQLVRQRELSPQVRQQLLEVFPNKCNKIILLCDDSNSMSLPICEEGTDPFAFKGSTRWQELKN